MKKLKNISEKQIEMYLSGKLNSSEQMQIEEFLSENPFEAEALEGLKSIGAEERERDLATLKQQLPHNQTPSFRLGWAGIAAAIVFLVSTVFLATWLLKNPQIEENVALKENSAKEQTTLPQTNDEKKANDFSVENSKKEESNSQTIQPEMPKNKQKGDILDLEKEDEVLSAEKTQTPEEKKMGEIKEEKPIVENKKEEKEIGENIIDKSNEGKVRNDFKGEALKDKKIEQEIPKQSSTAIIKADEKEIAQYKRQERKAAKKQKSKTEPNQEQRALNMSKETDFGSAYYYSLSGQVLDSSTKKTLGGVDVTVKNQNLQIKTDSLGNYLLRSRENNNILLFRKDGYEQQEIQVSPNEKRIIYLKPKF
ncbi:MAG: carboxypeptidase-like regulatory domain-containing protein [Raineya sp.]|jgi:hypothetical protein|nr:carboxypeptidase-like regulatory domain-containing protein [Raineya sp.]